MGMETKSFCSNLNIFDIFGFLEVNLYNRTLIFTQFNNLEKSVSRTMRQKLKALSLNLGQKG